MNEKDQKLLSELSRIMAGVQAGTVRNLIVFAKFDTHGDAIDDVTIVKGIGKQELQLVEQLRGDVIAMSE